MYLVFKSDNHGNFILRGYIPGSLLEYLFNFSVLPFALCATKKSSTIAQDKETSIFKEFFYNELNVLFMNYMFFYSPAPEINRGGSYFIA